MVSQRFSAIERARAYEPTGENMKPNAGIALADEIESSIADAYLEPGQLFATEEELRPRHDSGRSTIRQAARILEQRGVAYMRRGVGGGLIVMEPDPESIGRMLAMVIGSRLGSFFDMLRLVKATDASIIPSGIYTINLAECDRLREIADRNEQMPVDEFLMSRAHWHLLRSALGSLGNAASMLAYQTWNEINADLIPHSMQVSETRRRGEYWALTLQGGGGAGGGRHRRAVRTQKPADRLRGRVARLAKDGKPPPAVSPRSTVPIWSISARGATVPRGSAASFSTRSGCATGSPTFGSAATPS